MNNSTSQTIVEKIVSRVVGRKVSAGDLVEALPIDTLTLLGNALDQAGFHDEALRVLHVALELRPNDYVANTYLARTVWDYDYDEAARLYAAALAARPDDAVAVREYGWLLDHYLLESTRAIQLYRRELGTHPDDPTLHLYLGHALLNSGDFDGAIEAYAETLRLDPQRQTASLRMAECCLLKGDLDAVVRICKPMYRTTPGFQPAHACLGEAFLRRGDVAGAVAELVLATDGGVALSVNGEAEMSDQRLVEDRLDRLALVLRASGHPPHARTG